MIHFFIGLLFTFAFSQEGPFNSYKALLDLAEKNISLSQTLLLKVSIPGSKIAQQQKDCEMIRESIHEAQRSLVSFKKSPSERNGFQQSEFVARYKELDQRFTQAFASQKTHCASPAPKQEIKRSRRTQA